MTPEHRRIERREDPAPTGSEFDMYKREAEKRAVIGAAIGVLIILLFCLNAYGTFIKNPADREHGDEATRLSQFQNCIQSGNELRGQMRDEFVDLKQDTIIPIAQAQRGLWKRILAVSPPPQTEQEQTGFDLVTDNIAELTKIIDRLHRRVKTIENRIPDVDCLDRYPPLGGQTYPPDLVKEAEAQLPQE